MNDLRRVKDGSATDYEIGEDHAWDDIVAPSAQGFREVQAAFEPASLSIPLPAPLAPRQRKIGVRLNRIARAGLVVPDVSSLPRPLRDRQVKRALDLVVASLLLVLLAVPMLAIALALFLTGGPVLFVQSRVGKGRSRFACLKFRTMHRDAEARLAAVLAADPVICEEWQVHQKLSRDPRITFLGNFLRRMSLDELPQLFNVLAGQMSLVGPRPVIAPEIDGYNADRAYYGSHAFEDYAGCLPGITGLWQVAGRHDTSHQERVDLDRIYARNWSVILDLKILWRTIGVVLAGSGR